MSTSPEHHQVVVIGGGIVGLACALELASNDVDVVLLEQSTCGREASSAAAGLLQPFAEVLPPGPMLSASLEALDIWPQWLGEVQRVAQANVEYASWGTLFVAWNQEEVELIERTASTAISAGRSAERLNANEIAQRVPQLAAGAIDGLHLTSERRVDNLAACSAAVDACRARGVDVLEQSPVTSVEIQPRDAVVRTRNREFLADRVVVAAGAWSGGIPGLPTFPVAPRRGQIVCYRGCRWDWSGCIRRGRRYALRRGVGRLLVGSTVEDAGFDASTTHEVIQELKAFANGLFPELKDLEPAEAWAGLRPGTPDDLPLIGRWPDTPIWLATGHFRSGILLAPWTAKRLTSWMLRDSEPVENPFSPTRLQTGLG